MTFRVTDLMFDVVAKKPGKKKLACPAPSRKTPKHCPPKTHCGDCTKTDADCQGCTRCSPCTGTALSGCTTASNERCAPCPDTANESNNLVELRNALRARLQKVEHAA
jgi:hypothetical protein